VAVEPGGQGREADLYYDVHDASAAVGVAGAPSGDRVHGLSLGSTAVYVGRTPGVDADALRASVGTEAHVDVADPFWLVALPLGRAGVVRLTMGRQVDLAAVPLQRRHQPDMTGLDERRSSPGWQWGTG
jgi:hypothetical protein